MNLSEKQPAKGKIFQKKYLAYDFVKITACLPGLLLWRPKRLYVSEQAKQKVKGRAMVVSNHLSHIDPVYLHLVFWYRRLHILAMKELFVGKNDRFFRAMQCIPVDRQRFSLDSFRQVCDNLNEEQMVCIFPEGSINHGEGVNAFKSGAVLMALKGSAPIVPVYMAKKKHLFSRLISVVGEPVDIQAMCGPMPDIGEIEKISELLRQKEAELMKFYNRERGN